MGKEVVDTFKPYKGFYQSNRDFLLPLRGIKNIIQGLANILFIPVHLALVVPVILVGALIGLIALFCKKYRAAEWGGTAALIALGSPIYIASYGVDGLAHLFKGITQVAATPLTWLIKMPLRGLITACTGVPAIEAAGGRVNRLAKKGSSSLEIDMHGVGKMSMRDIIKAIHCKFLVSSQKGQHSWINPELEQQKAVDALQSLKVYEALPRGGCLYYADAERDKIAAEVKAKTKNYLELFISSPEKDKQKKFLLFFSKAHGDYKKHPEHQLHTSGVLPPDITRKIAELYFR
jgi:hypothetical protein